VATEYVHQNCHHPFLLLLEVAMVVEKFVCDAKTFLWLEEGGKGLVLVVAKVAENFVCDAKNFVCEAKMVEEEEMEDLEQLRLT